MNPETLSLILWLGFGLFAILFIIGMVVIVPEKDTVIIQRFGKFSRVLTSGFNLKIPIIESKAGVINMRVQQLDVDVETKTKDNVFVNLRMSVQYMPLSSKVFEAFYALDDPHAQIASYVFARKDDIAIAVKKNLELLMDDYGYSIVKTLITDIEPDHLVKESMNRINAAKRNKHAAEEEAEGEKIIIIKRAEAEAESKRLQGEGIAKQRLEIVRGFKESVEDFQKSLKDVGPEEVMQFVLMTQYFDTLSHVGGSAKSNTILIPHSPGAMADFQQQIVQGTLVGQKLSQQSNQEDEAPES